MKGLYDFFWKFLNQKRLFILLPFALFYKSLLKLRRFNSPVSLSKKIIGIGNITLGGSGKTECCLSIIEFLKKEGKRVGLLKRGYMGKIKRNLLIKGGDVICINSKWQSCHSEAVARLPKDLLGDEEFMLSNLLDIPIFVGKDRLLGSFLLSEFCDWLVFDDAFQYLKIKKDIDIVLINSINPFGNGWLFPAGFLREDLSSLKRADILILTKCNLVCQKVLNDLEVFLKKFFKKPILKSQYLGIGLIDKKGNFYPFEVLKRKNILMASCIADPISFERIICQYTTNLRHIKFLDHWRFKTKDVEYLRKLSKGYDFFLTTRKDFFKLKDFLENIMYLEVKFQPLFEWRDYLF